MEVVGVIYDRAIFLTDEEYRSAHGKKICVQAAVEAPFIRLLSMSGSTNEEQLRVVPDRADDFHSVSPPLCQEVGDPLCDRLVGFTGDLQTRWMDGGLQKGSPYRCGSGCGLPISEFPSYAASVRQMIPSYKKLHQRATAGHYGNIVGYNLHGLNAKEL